MCRWRLATHPLSLHISLMHLSICISIRIIRFQRCEEILFTLSSTCNHDIDVLTILLLDCVLLLILVLLLLCLFVLFVFIDLILYLFYILLECLLLFN